MPWDYEFNHFHYRYRSSQSNGSWRCIICKFHFECCISISLKYTENRWCIERRYFMRSIFCLLNINYLRGTIRIDLWRIQYYMDPNSSISKRLCCLLKRVFCNFPATCISLARTIRINGTLSTSILEAFWQWSSTVFVCQTVNTCVLSSALLPWQTIVFTLALQTLSTNTRKFARSALTAVTLPIRT